MLIHFPIYLSIIPVVLSLIGIAAGLWLLSKSKFGWLVLVGALLFSVTIGPSMFFDEISINDTAITHRTGIWFYQRVYGLEYADTEKIVIQLEKNRDDRDVEIWILTDPQQHEERVDPGDLWVLHRDTILTACKDAAVEVVDLVP